MYPISRKRVNLSLEEKLWIIRKNQEHKKNSQTLLAFAFAFWNPPQTRFVTFSFQKKVLTNRVSLTNRGVTNRRIYCISGVENWRKGCRIFFKKWVFFKNIKITQKGRKITFLISNKVSMSFEFAICYRKKLKFVINDWFELLPSFLDGKILACIFMLLRERDQLTTRFVSPNPTKNVSQFKCLIWPTI